MENTNGRNKGRDLLLANKLRIVPWGTERRPQSIQKHERATLHWLAHPQWEQDKTKTSGSGNKKVYELVPQSWIINCRKISKLSDEVINFIGKIVKTWRVEITAGGKSLAEAKIQRDIFQGNALSPLMFIFAMIPILRKCKTGYKLGKSQEKINHLMYVDDISWRP